MIKLFILLIMSLKCICRNDRLRVKKNVRLNAKRLSDCTTYYFTLINVIIALEGLYLCVWCRNKMACCYSIRSSSNAQHDRIISIYRYSFCFVIRVELNYIAADGLRYFFAASSFSTPTPTSSQHFLYNRKSQH